MHASVTFDIGRGIRIVSFVGISHFESSPWNVGQTKPDWWLSLANRQQWKVAGQYLHDGLAQHASRLPGQLDRRD